MQDLTERDKIDMTEGIKKRPEHKWKRQVKLSIDQKLEEELINGGSQDIGRIARKYKKPTSEVVHICKTIGIC
jgi:hypothetical protein